MAVKVELVGNYGCGIGGVVEAITVVVVNLSENKVFKS